MTQIDDTALTALEAAVGDALVRANPGNLPVLGFGEISLVVAWPPEQPRWACKRLPVFSSRDRFDGYASDVAAYLDVLRDRGVDVVDTDLRAVPAAGGGVAGYCVQPALREDVLLPELLRRAEPAGDHPLLVTVVETVARVVDPVVGIDAQVSNWGLVDGRLGYFDVTTPLLRDGGRDQIDLAVLTAMLPWLARPAVTRWVAPGILARYHDRRLVLLDIAVNLVRERLAPWVPALIAAARDHAGVTLTEAEVRRDYRSEARTWGWLMRARRMDRRWQRAVRRRTYPFLIPADTGW